MFPVNGLYGHIRNNALKSALLLAGFVVLIALYWWAGCLSFAALMMLLDPTPLRGLDTLGAFYATMDRASKLAAARSDVPLIISTLWFAAAWGYHKRLMQAATGARPVERGTAPKLYNLVENLAISAGLPVPRIEIIETPELNAYAAGLTPASATIAVSRGLLEALSQDELEAVLAHEMTHIQNRDVQLMTVAAIFAGGITLAGDLLNSYRPRGNWNFNVSINTSGSSAAEPVEGASAAGKSAILGTILALVIGLIVMGLAQVFALLSQFALSRSREFLADAGSVELTKNPDALISALQRISQNDQVPLASEGLRAMMISSCAAGGESGSLLATHPPIEDRISALEHFAGGHVNLPRRRPVPTTPAAGLEPARPSFGTRILPDRRPGLASNG